jgi:flavin-dependent dehydrogenase
MYHSLCETDVFVVGGGPAGLAAAIAARQAGFSVTLTDVAYPPIDKTCGEGIMPDGLGALWKLGISPSARDGFPFAGIRFSDATSAVSARFPGRYGLGIRRTRLHELMIHRATELGIAMHWGARVTGISEHGVSVYGRNVRCRWLVGADGHQSRVRAWSGLELPRYRKRRFGFRRHYRISPWSELVEVYWTECGQLYVTPVAEDQVCVALITHQKGTRLDDALKACPELATRLAHSPQITREQGAISASCCLRKVCSGSRALIGEASGSVDAITGEGLSMAFQQAHALAEALKGDSLRIYADAHRRIARTPRLTGHLMLLMDRSKWLRQRGLHALAAEPSLFSRMLAVHIGDITPIQFGVQGTLSLGWRLITA